jgi:hypothetical protein
MMTDTKKIVGDIGIGGLGYINAILMSRPNRIYSPIRFCVDTGCSVTIISHLDALRMGLDYSNNKSLQKSDQQTINGVRAFIPLYYLVPKFYLIPKGLLYWSMLEIYMSCHHHPLLPVGPMMRVIK